VSLVSEAYKIDHTAVEKAYAVEMKMLSDDGSFDPAGMETVRKSMVELHVLDKLPAMSDLYTDRFVPVNPN
jgi:hypothetical protein